ARANLLQRGRSGLAARERLPDSARSWFFLLLRRRKKSARLATLRQLALRRWLSATRVWRQRPSRRSASKAAGAGQRRRNCSVQLQRGARLSAKTGGFLIRKRSGGTPAPGAFP